MLRSLMIVVSLLVLPAQAEEAMVVSTQRLTMETALVAANAAINACRKKGVQVGVTVVDRSGQTQVALRDVLAPDLTLTISYQKAYTAISFLAATSALERQAQSPLAHVDNLFFGGGGLPIAAAGQFLAAIGVSGAPSAKTDEECAEAGVKAIIDDLEMSL